MPLPSRPELFRPVLAWREETLRARRRVGGSLWPALQASLAATLAWVVAHGLLGHPQPFFAPIAAAISVSISHSRRSLRIVQMVVGVLLGIGVAEVLAALLGTGTVALGLIVFTTMVVALLAGAGFVGQGLMFVNQAAASAILVVALHRHGTGAERGLDAVIGGASAFLVGVVLFPADPLPRLRAVERDVLRALAAALGHVAELLRRAETPEAGWTLAMGYDVHVQLARLADAREIARINVRVAPRRWHLRGAVADEDRRIAQLDLLANAVLSLVRTASAALHEEADLPDPLVGHIAELATVLDRLASTEQPWPGSLLDEAGEVADRAIHRVSEGPIDAAPVIAAIVRATGRDLARVISAEN
jgi:uncharacterized membrane protein YgaE (UPF0421/DUF939 family)